MKIAEAKAECQRWLDYLQRQKEKAAAIQAIAADRRAGKYNVEEGGRWIRAIDSGATVYDGAKLAEAVTVLMKLADR